VREIDVEDSGKGRGPLAEGNASPRDAPASIAATRGDLPEEPVSSSGREELVEEMRRLETELERYRAHAERTSKLFLSATKYAEWVRENARRDGELAMRKARARAEKLTATASELERTALELVRVQDELARLQDLTEETRERLSAFLTAGLEALDKNMASGQREGSEPARGDLQDTLHRQLTSSSLSTLPRLADVERPEA
jgi:cell division septum initiation protein DivIVA